MGTEVGEVNQKVDTLSGEVEKTQERVKRNEVRIDEVDKQAQAGIADAKGSAQQALTAGHGGGAGGQGQAHLHGDPLQRQGHLPREPGRGQRRRQGRSSTRPSRQLKAENRGVFFEIEGHTDSTGPDAYNVKLGEERATAVRNYLHDQHGIALSRIEVISYGESQAGRGQQDEGPPGPEPPGRHQGPRVGAPAGGGLVRNPSGAPGRNRAAPPGVS